MTTKSKKNNYEHLNNIEKFYTINSFFDLLKTTKKYKELFTTLEAKLSCIMSTIIIIIFIQLYRTVEIDVFNNLIRNILLSISIAYISILGFIVSGIAIISGTISNKVIETINKEGKADALVGILFSFWFIGAFIGISLASYLIFYLCTYLELLVTVFRLVTITGIFSYMFWFIILYSISLLGTCLKVFLVSYKFSQMRNEEEP